MGWMALVSSMIWLEKQLLVLLLLLLDCLPLVVGQHVALPVRKVHVDHPEGRQEDGFERHDRGEQSERVGLDQEADPGGKPDDVVIDASAVKPTAVFPQEVARQQWLAWARGGAVTAPKTSLPRQHG
jgi:hypothetical protein